ncbi:MAG: DUF308 domain-containing protein [Clostridiales bacterium]|nr:DUF308 domain-containing protein [Clostridiales bacterium]
MTLRENNMVVAWFSILLGAIFIINPGGTGKVIVVIAGVVLLIVGIADIIRRFTTGNDCSSGARRISGFVKLILGIFVLTHIGTVLALLAYILGIVILVWGGRNLEDTLWQKHEGMTDGTMRILWSVLVIAAGVFLLFFPFGAVNTVILIAGVILVLYGVSELYTLYRDKK